MISIDHFAWISILRISQDKEAGSGKQILSMQLNAVPLKAYTHMHTHRDII